MICVHTIRNLFWTHFSSYYSIQIDAFGVWRVCSSKDQMHRTRYSSLQRFPASSEPSTRPLQIEPHADIPINFAYIQCRLTTNISLWNINNITSQGRKLIIIHTPQKFGPTLYGFLSSKVFFSFGGMSFAVMLRKGVGLYDQDVYCSSGLATGGAGQGGQSPVRRFMEKTCHIWMWFDPDVPKR